MTHSARRTGRPVQIGLTAVLMLATTLVLAGDRTGKRVQSGQFNPDHQTVEMFAAIQKGDIDVKLIPKDSTECKVMIENKTDRPLNVKLPDAFAGVPVLAQMGMGGMGGGMGGMGGGQGMGGGMGGMGMGGGMGGGGMGGGGMGGGGGFFNVAPEKVGKFQVPTVCLEHGKPEPRPAMKYEIRPIEKFTDKPAVHELCRMVGLGRINQRAAQAAAWHMNNNMSWQQLAAKQLRFANGTSRPYFSAEEIQAGMQVATVAVQLAQQRQQQSPATTEAASAK